MSNDTNVDSTDTQLICGYCGMPIESFDQECPARDTGLCDPVEEHSPPSPPDCPVCGDPFDKDESQLLLWEDSFDASEWGRVCVGEGSARFEDRGEAVEERDALYVFVHLE